MPTSPRIVTANGLVVEGDPDRATASTEIARRMLQLVRSGKASTMRDALRRALAENKLLAHVYTGGR